MNNLSPRTRLLITIIVLILSLVVPFLWIIAIVLVWRFTGWARWIKILVSAAYVLLPIVLSSGYLFMYVFLFRPFQITGDAMNPSYKNGEYLLTKIVHGEESISRGDVVIHQNPINPDRDFIKRVIGIPGEAVMLNGGTVYINDEALDESAYLPMDTVTYGGSFLQEGETVIVPEDSYFVLGDNRAQSSDSREFGLVNTSHIISKVMYCYWNCE